MKNRLETIRSIVNQRKASQVARQGKALVNAQGWQMLATIGAKLDR